MKRRKFFFSFVVDGFVVVVVVFINQLIQTGLLITCITYIT
jgi:hypothetical protein